MIADARELAEHAFGRVDADRERRDGRDVAIEAEHPPDRQPRAFPEQIVQRDIERAARRRRQPAQRRVPGVRIFGQPPVLQRGDDGFDGLAVAFRGRRLTDRVQTVGLEPDDDRARRARGAPCDRKRIDERKRESFEGEAHAGRFRDASRVPGTPTEWARASDG